MLRTMLKSKIHRATVTQADLHHAGSLTVDADLMDAADLLPGEQVAVVDVTNGARLQTYVVRGERGSGVLGVNGAAAHLVGKGHLVIVISYATMDDEVARSHRPRVVFVDGANRAVSLGDELAESRAGSEPAGDAPVGGALVAGGPASGEPGPSSETDDAARLDALIQAEA